SDIAGRAAKEDKIGNKEKALELYTKAAEIFLKAIKGDVLVTISTGDDEADDVGLVPTHAYAVLDAREINGLQLLQVKNPWSMKRWTGPYSHLDAINWTPELMSLLKYDRLQAIDNDDEIKNDTEKYSETRILLSKHIMTTWDIRDYITLHLYDNSEGKKVYYPDNPCKTLRFNAPPGISRYTIVVDIDQEVDKNPEMKSLEFTLKCYCESQFKLTEIQTNYPIEQQVDGKWTTQTAGGNPSKITYLNNPQYRLSITPPSCISPMEKIRIQLILKGPNEYAIHVKLVRGNAGDYTIVISTFEAGLVGDYVLTVASNDKFNLNSIPLEGAVSLYDKVYITYRCSDY
ncbi:19292_t:CDS:2, partial [Racocetra fulgida]